MQSSIFKKYDIRGKIGTELFESEIYNLAKAIAYYFTRYSNSVNTVIIGKDSRESSAFIDSEITQAFLDSGLNVINLGYCTTPIIYFAFNILPVQASIMITASNNDPDYNGIKIYLNKEPIWGSQIELIKDIFYSKKYYNAFVKGVQKHHNIVEGYIDWLCRKFSYLEKFEKKLNINCSIGIPSKIIEELLQKLQFKNFVISDNLITDNIITNDAISLGLDSDGDRLFVYKNSRLVNSDKIIALFAKDIALANPNCSIIYDIKCSLALDDLMNKLNIKYKRVIPGHVNIKNEMKNSNAIFAGEFTGHFYFKDSYFGYDDGIYSMLRLVDLINKTGKNIDELLQDIPYFYNTPELIIPCKSDIIDNLILDTQKYFAAKKDVSISNLDGLQAILPYGWGLIRKSNTKEALSLRLESKTPDGFEKIKDDFIQILKNYIDQSIVVETLNKN